MDISLTSDNHPIKVTGVSFGDKAIEIIYIDEDNQFDEQGDMHTIYLDTKDPELTDDYNLLQSQFRDLIEFYHERNKFLRAQRMGGPVRVIDDVVDKDEFEAQVELLRSRMEEPDE
jgi:hypothetical protein